MRKYIPLLLTLAALAALALFSAQAAEGARHGLDVCAASLAPSLFPFFVLADLLSLMGLPALLSGRLGRPLGRMFRISGAGVQAFLLGLTGGYPVGAVTTAQLRRDGLVSRQEAERLLSFCNNSGPGFILGAAGGVFGSPRAGLLLYVTHVLAAVCVGLVMRGRGPVPAAAKAAAEPLPFAAALPRAVSQALASTLTVCSYVVLFSALLGLLPGGLPLPAGALAPGLVELGTGISAFAGAAPTPMDLAAAASILGWGGISVHCQTLAAVAGTDIKCARHLAGRALCGVFAAVSTYGLALLLFP